ncbi:MAG: FKBP-type peptidyl-prolyl cis-trans isomerase [Isosphaeraceae bacterium]|nr:FKBP-type peptidyl-prolyl cis-trans isomerase [Isosphaeraceae bacterium]
MSKRFLVLLIAVGSAAGCNPPTQIVSVPFPGVEYKRQPPPPIDGGAQALGEQPAATSTAPPAVISKEKVPPTAVGQTVTTKSGLQVTTLKPGTGAEVEPGNLVHMKYVGKLDDGTQFDAGLDFEFRVGTGAVIRGWDEGVPGMKVGEIRKLVIPAELGYGSRGSGKIPPNSRLTFEIEATETHP